MEIQVLDKLIVAHKANVGYSWTLTSRLGDALIEAENLFGPRDRLWTILGWEFTADGPRIWYLDPDSKQIIIQLNTSVADYHDKAVYQLCHEVIHC